jgi:hypothetical protein
VAACVDGVEGKGYEGGWELSEAVFGSAAQSGFKSGTRYNSTFIS